MPKIGQAEDTRPYNTRCLKCGCIVEKVVDRFGFDGKPSRHIYRCPNPYHNCGTVERDGCTPARKYEATAHALWDGAGGEWEHPGPVEECIMPECVERMTHKGPDGSRHPGTYLDCGDPGCEPPFEGARAPWAYSDEHVESWTIGRDPDPRPDPLGQCPVYGTHRWTWADDGNGHSGDVCMCGAYEE